MDICITGYYICKQLKRKTMIEIKDTRKTATKDPRPKMGDVVRIDKEYFICGSLDHEKLVLICLTDGINWDTPKKPNENKEYVFDSDELAEEDIEVITNKITLTIE